MQVGHQKEDHALELKVDISNLPSRLVVTAVETHACREKETELLKEETFYLDYNSLVALRTPSRDKDEVAMSLLRVN
ncbi:hypothetical protein SUGI_1201260 [Cryptomeria japonica]|nr:hypothetical protein SUGI_1201260 [Cryptomeria japonica]